MSLIRLFIDEDSMNRQFVRALRARGVDVTTVGEIGTTSTLARSGMKSLGLARFVRFDDKAIHLPNNHRRLAREKIWMVSAAALGGWLQVFASPHFSRLPSFFDLENRVPEPP